MVKMKLRDILKLDNKKLADTVVIEYRTFYNNQDILYGYAEFNRGQLRPLDHDSYSLDDEFDKWEFNSAEYPNDSLTVWYDSVWFPKEEEK
jgi:hypothetical protein